MDTNRTFLRIMALSVMLMLAGIPGIAQSAIVTNTFIGTVEKGPLKGQTGIGSFSYDEDELILADDILDPQNGLKVNFTFDGLTYIETNDPKFDEFPTLEFDFFEPIALDYDLRNGINGVFFNNPLIVNLSIYDLFPSSGNYDYVTEIEATVVPIPGAVWLLGAGLLGLVGIRRKFKKN